MISIMDYGACANGKTLCTEAFARAIEDCRAQNRTLLVPAGEYYTGTINLKGVSMHLCKGARIIGSSDPEDYPEQAYVHNEMGVLRALVVSLEGENMVIDGEGTIDLNGSSFFDFDRPIVPDTLVPMTEEEKRFCTVERDWRPTMSVFFNNVNGLVVRGIEILDAPCWTLTASRCKNVKLTDLNIHTHLNIPNDDGIHISGCEDVIISRCHITSGDDCIALSCITDWEVPCTNIVISDCVLMSCSKAIVVGYQFSQIRNVVISNVIIRDSNRGLCFMCHDKGGMVEHVRVSNMIIDTAIRPGNWWGNGEAIFMEALPSDGSIPEEQKTDRNTPINYRDIEISNVSCTSDNAIGAVGMGDNYEAVCFRDINVTLKDARYMHLKGHTFDTSPSPEPVPIPDDCAVYIYRAKGLELKNVTAAKFHGKEQMIVRVD